jgi:hypothetical protein
MQSMEDGRRFDCGKTTVTLAHMDWHSEHAIDTLLHALPWIKAIEAEERACQARANPSISLNAPRQPLSELRVQLSPSWYLRLIVAAQSA